MATSLNNTTILGAAAEHDVMCQLLRRQMTAALAPAGVPDADIIVSDRLGSALSVSHEAWLAQPGLGGRIHNDHDMRRLLPSCAHLGVVDHKQDRLDQFREAWQLIHPAGDSIL